MDIVLIRDFGIRPDALQLQNKWLEKGDLNLRDLHFRGRSRVLRAILWGALASVRASKKFCVGVRSPLLDDGPTVPGNAACFFGI
jgi:hypothetical protein